MSAGDGERGSILLPVLLLLLLVATAATAMTLQAQTSLREAATRRDRLLLGIVADAAVRGVALAMAQAAGARAAPPFALDGTPQGCRFADGRRLAVSVQDEGGRIDLNKGKPELITQVLTRAGLGGFEATALTKAILARRSPATTQRNGRSDPRATAAHRGAEGRPFVAADELGDLSGMTPENFVRLGPMFTVANGSAGIDPQVAAPAIRALIPPKDLAAPAFEPMTTPSMHEAFTIEVVAAARSGQRFGRRALFRLDPDAGALGRFTAWDTLALADLPSDAAPSSFCRGLVTALTAY